VRIHSPSGWKDGGFLVAKSVWLPKPASNPKPKRQNYENYTEETSRFSAGEKPKGPETQSNASHEKTVIARVVSKSTRRRDHRLN